MQGQRPRQMIIDELAEVTAPADDRWTHVRGTATKIKKGPLKGSVDIELVVLGKRENGEEVSMGSHYTMASPDRLYDPRAAFAKVLDGMVNDLESAPAAQVFSERNPRS